MHVRTDIWNQFGGNPAGSGFRAISTSGSILIDWQRELPASAGTSSPVIGPDGTIYIGTTNGRLLAIEPVSGHLKWNVEIAAFYYAVQTPAVADDGAIYCLCRSPRVQDHRPDPDDNTQHVWGAPSFVVRVDPNGVIHWRRQIQALSDQFGNIVNCDLRGAPRIVSGPRGIARVVFALRYVLHDFYPEVSPQAEGPKYVRVLVIVDETGSFLLFNRYEERHDFVDVHGGAHDWFGPATIADPPPETPPCADTPVVFGSFPAREPWTIITAGDLGLYKIRWNDQEGALAGAPKQFYLPQPFPAPVAFSNGLLVGSTRSDVTFIDSDTFTQYLPHPTKLNGNDPATVAGGLRQMYFLTHSGVLFAVDSNGAVLHRFDALNGKSVALPALSANHVHVVTTQEFVKFLSLDLTLNARRGDLFHAPHAGFSSPAIGPSGEVYVVGGPDFATAPSLYRFTGDR